MAALPDTSMRMAVPPRGGPMQRIKPDTGMRERLWTIAPLVALIYSILLLPPEIQVNIAGLKVTGYRVVILFFIVPAFLRYFGRGYRVSLADLLVMASSFWTILGFSIVYSPAEGLVRGSAVVLDALGAYLVARTSISSHDDLRRVLIVVAPGFAASAIVLMMESVSSSLIFRPALASVFGSVNVYSGGEESGALSYMNNERLGLLRGYAGFSHPILAGVTLASLLPVYLMSGLRSWPKWLGLIAATFCIFSMSSVAFLALGLSIAFLAADRLKNHVRHITWPLITTLLGAFMLLFHMATENGIFRWLIRYTFSPHNGRVRLIQWESGIASMNDHPWFGVGYAVVEIAPWLPSSIDAHFLAIGVRSGWIVPLLLFAACIAIMIALGMSIHRHAAKERNLIAGLNMSIALLVVASMTVAYYAETNIYFMAVLGIGATIAALPSRVARVAPVRPQLRRPAMKRPEPAIAGR